MRHRIERFLRNANPAGPYPKALIVPYAGLDEAAPVAANGYILLKPIRSTVHRVVLLFPSPKRSFHGLATSPETVVSTPLGLIPLDWKSIEACLRMPQIHLLDAAHRPLEGHDSPLLFLQVVLSEFSLIPLTFGHVTLSEVADVLDHLWGSDETLIVVCSNLSHGYDYRTARRLDSETAHLIERCQADLLDPERTEGVGGIGGLLQVAKRHGLHVRTLDLRNSADLAGSDEAVVGYGAFAVHCG